MKVKNLRSPCFSKGNFLPNAKECIRYLPPNLCKRLRCNTFHYYTIQWNVQIFDKSFHWKSETKSVAYAFVMIIPVTFVGRNSLVDKDSLRAGQSGDRIPMEESYPAPTQTGPGVRLTSYTISTVSFPEIKRLGRTVDYPSLSVAELKEKVELYIYSLSGPSWPVLGFTFYTWT